MVTPKPPLTERQQQALDFITACLDERGYPPTLREIGEHMGIRSTNGVNDHLKALEKKGYLAREDLKSRALRPLRAIDGGKAPARGGAGNVAPALGMGDDMVEIPLVGRVAAGQPLLAVENREDTVRVDRFFIGNSKTGEVFALRVK